MGTLVAEPTLGVPHPRSNVLLFALVLLFVMPTAASAGPHARASQSRTLNVRFRADRISGVLRRAQQQPRSTATVQRYLRSGYQHDISHLLDGVATLNESASQSPRERLRTIASVIRTMVAAERAQPGTHSNEIIDRAHRMLASARVAARVGSHETAVELELDMNNLIVDAITTADGTIASVLREGGRAVPVWLTQFAGATPVEQVRWDSLSHTQKLQLLQSQARSHFFVNRSIPGVRFRSRIAAPSRIAKGLGRVAVRGGLLDVQDVLLPRVEYESMDSIRTLDGVEAHVRQSGEASLNLADSETIRDALGNQTAATHQHITARLSPEILRGDEVERVGLVDFYRRVNLVAELRLINRGGRLRKVGRSFDFLHGEQLSALNEHLASLSSSGPSPISESSLKLTAVGFRTGDLYGDESLIGFEARTLEGHADQDREGEFVDAIQRGLVGRHYGLSRAQYATWLARVRTQRGGSTSAQGQALAALHYNRDPSDMLDHLPSGITLSDDVALRLIDAMADDYGAKMLIHDWSQDPVFEGDNDAVELVQAAQQHALSRLEDRRADPRQIVRDFVRHAGLVERFEASINMPRRP